MNGAFSHQQEVVATDSRYSRSSSSASGNGSAWTGVQVLPWRFAPKL
jgi:hypothetical protein